MNVKQKGSVSIMRYACTHVKSNVWVEKIFIVLGKECQRGSHHIHTHLTILIIIIIIIYYQALII